jgi:multimeric flavodoxin WrbA
MTMSAPSLKVAIVFHSRSGNTLRLAQAIVAGAEHVPGASVTLRRVSELADERELMSHEHTGKAFAEIQPIACATRRRMCWPAMSSYSAARPALGQFQPS